MLKRIGKGILFILDCIFNIILLFAESKIIANIYNGITGDKK